MNVALELAERNDIAAPAMRRCRRFSLAEYEKMIEVGILTEQDHVELIRGEILEKIYVAGSRVRPHHRFSFDNYKQMIESGILTEQDRCELIRGEVVEKMTSGKKHAACVKRLNRLLGRLVGDHAIIGVQDPVEAIKSCPEPDITLLSPRDDFYSESVPRTGDIMLLIEVADSSLEYDRTAKLSLYAEAGIREYWIANVNNDCVEVYRNPQPNGTYADERVLNLGETLDIAALPGVLVAVDHVFKARRDG